MTTLELTQLEAILERMAEKMQPVKIPLSVELWSTRTCAAYLGCSESNFGQKYACLLDFPAAIRLPQAGGRRSQPRWKAREVIAWAEKYQGQK